jgi:hypothetical protein
MPGISVIEIDDLQRPVSCLTNVAARLGHSMEFRVSTLIHTHL